MSDREPMTQVGYQKLKDELKRLRTVERPAVSEAIEEARAHGDLSENAEYHAAKEKQSFIEGRIKELESKIALADVIDPSTLSGDKVVFGATVTIVDLDSDEASTYQIVGLEEADIKAGKISVTAPMARALIGRRLGDEVVVRLPKKGEKEYEITKIEFV
ncbi:MAG TPA: transcription elongation factor GreA [Myxococcales bacterium LLY-WYZ-16_1]|jgi:transcription elongation factor GreA|nr:transcription elongation factor GreA [Myxococcales bacterium LLY-WYZ-16_1]